MPYRYVIDNERRVVVSVGWDCVTFADATSHQIQLLSDPDFNPEFNQLVDATAVTALDLSVDEIVSSQPILLAVRRRTIHFRQRMMSGRLFTPTPAQV